MQDQEQLTKIELPSKKPNLFHDWWEEMYPKEFFLTFKNYFLNHKQFFDEVFNEQWDNKVKPMGFLLTAIALSLVIGSISPWGLDLSEEPVSPPAWQEMTNIMGEEDNSEFITAFNLQEAMTIVDDNTRYAAVDSILRDVIGTDSALNAKQIQDYLEAKDYGLLATRAEYVVLKEKVAHNEFLKETEMNDVLLTVLINFFVLWLMLYWLVSHRFFKKANRSSRETVFVFMYGLGMIVFFVYVPFLAISGSEGDWSVYAFFAIIIVFFILVYKIFAIFRHTHNTGFFSLLKVYILTFFTTALFGLPLLFMKKRKKPVLVKNR